MSSEVQRFVIPKKKRIVSPDEGKTEHKDDVQLRSPTYEENEKLTEGIFASLSQKMLRKYFDIQNIKIVENPLLTEKFHKMKHTLRGFSYRTETLGFILIGSNDEELLRIVNNGLSVDYSLFSDLGVSKQGVPVYRFIDLVTPAPFFPNVKLRILCFQTLRGKSMEVELGSSSLCPQPAFNSHIVHKTHEQWNNLTTLDKFRSSAVYHFDFDANGHPNKYTSGLLPYAVFDLVPNYASKKVAPYALSRLWPAYQLTINGSVVPSTGLFAGSRCKLWTLYGTGTDTSLQNLSLLHVQEEFYKWKKFWKMPLFSALMKRATWGKLLKGKEFQIEQIGESTKPFVSYWGFNSNSPLFSDLTATLETAHMGLIGHCGDTIFFILPNGQMASLIGFPYVNASTSMLHCIAVNADHSAIGILQDRIEANLLERSISSACSRDFVTQDCVTTFHHRNDPRLVDNYMMPQETANQPDESKYQLYASYGLVPSTFFKDEYEPLNSIDANQTAATASASSATTITDKINEDMSVSGDVQQSCNDVEAEASGEDEFLDPYDLDYDLLFGEKELVVMDECAEEQLAKVENCKVEQELTVDDMDIESAMSTSSESINCATMPVACSAENELITSFVETPTKEVANNVMDYAESETIKDYETDPIMKGLINYIKTPAPPKIYNGCFGRGTFFTEGSERLPLLSTSPPLSKLAVLPPRKPRVATLPQPNLGFRPALLPAPRITPLSQIKIEVPPDMKVFPGEMPSKNADLTHPLLIIVDSDIMLGQLTSDDFHMMLRRLKLDKLLTFLPHKVVYHDTVDGNIREIIRNMDTSKEKKQCMQHYLRLLESYGREGIVSQMAPHRCDNKVEEDKVHCLRYTISAARRVNRSIQIVYLTDTANCSIQSHFKDPKIHFVNYDSWIKIFN